VINKFQCKAVCHKETGKKAWGDYQKGVFEARGKHLELQPIF